MRDRTACVLKSVRIDTAQALESRVLTAPYAPTMPLQAFVIGAQHIVGKAIRQARADLSYASDFLLPPKHSRLHLLNAEEDACRPH